MNEAFGICSALKFVSAFQHVCLLENKTKIIYISFKSLIHPVDPKFLKLVSMPTKTLY